MATYDNTHLASLHGFLRREESSVAGSASTKLVSYSHDTGSGPVVLLLHGYPQSAYIWRHVAANLKDDYSLFIPELPGYGISDAPLGELTFTSMGLTILHACTALFPDRPIILVGHDRGARISHRLAVDYSHRKDSAIKVKLLGCVLLDIVPTLKQWQSFSTAANVTRYFHWPFLASPVAPDMIQAYGGDKWCEHALDRIGGANTDGRKTFTSDASWDVYTSLFRTRAAIDGSCADYHAGAFVEPELQVADQAAGRKIKVPTLVGWSVRGLEAAHGPVGDIWENWVEPGTRLEKLAVGNNVGHYLPEEAPGVISKALRDFLGSLGK